MSNKERFMWSIKSKTKKMGGMEVKDFPDTTDSGVIRIAKKNRPEEVKVEYGFNDDMAELSYNGKKVSFDYFAAWVLNEDEKIINEILRPFAVA